MTLCRPLIFLLTYCIITPFPAYSWWETGHEVIARIAVAHLTLPALTRVSQILEVEETPESVADALAQASLWADQTKSETQTGSWHYIDLALQDHRSDIPKRCENDNCVTARIRLFTAQLASKTSAQDSRWSDLDALRFLVHFVGDVHQPLHAVSDADLGGNCELLDPPVNKAKNLHALWDGELVNALNTDDKALAADLEKEIATFNSWKQLDLASGDQDDWAWESHRLAEKYIYKRLKIPTQAVEFPAKCGDAPEAITADKLQIQAAYIDAMKPVVRSQLEKAGLRLARLLNESL
jgi:hypothetical protein